MILKFLIIFMISFTLLFSDGLDSGNIDDSFSGSGTAGAANIGSILDEGGNGKNYDLGSILQNIDWSNLKMKYSVDGIGKVCRGKYLSLGTLSYAEPVMIMEKTNDYLYLPFLDVHLSSNKMYNSEHRSGTLFYHLYKLGIMNTLFGDIQGLMCFQSATAGFEILKLSEIYPDEYNDFYANDLNQQITTLVNPASLLGGIAPCLAAEAMDIQEPGELGWETSAKILNLPSSPYDGCHDFQTINSMGQEGRRIHQETIDKLIGGLRFTHLYSSQLEATHEAPYLPDSKCAPAEYKLGVPFSQYFVTGVYSDYSSKQLGASIPDDFAFLPGDKDVVVYLVWKRRDIYSGAYSCY
jgi:hypothetical protein